MTKSYKEFAKVAGRPGATITDTKGNKASTHTAYNSKGEKVVVSVPIKENKHDFGGHELQQGHEIHRFGVTVSDPNHPAVSKRQEQVAKRIKVKAMHKDAAFYKAKEYYTRQGYKVHDIHHIEQLKD